jgi:AcrR family transcriptional regulator
MVRPVKKKQIPNLQEAIKEAAWGQIAEVGAPALSLRAVARKLKITAPAIYNYFPDRDALVTQLIIDAYTSFGDSQIAARDSIPAKDHKKRMFAIGMAYRTWAHEFPQRYQLIFGTPIPGYKAPFDEVFPSSARSLSALVSAVEELRLSGKLNVDNFPKIKSDYKVTFEMWKRYGNSEADVLSLSVAMIIWSRVHGIVSLEVQGNLPPFGEKGDALYIYELNSIGNTFIKE